ncbi:MAG: 50S ribosomal protein L5 [Candidatus Yanofskybacteria bacterium RIFCSPHIGHO2_02_FULL_50_12]|uniref:Large ribosomal subunit protein uL5 n=1 Tax=Candidatus Yanofskybacteria bacterium RIFCSPHIGHO2_02_FULL_50_12 TaxID=1802685 RepID=A0A1F8FX82_9BACT|nr:MAG: 50S ribosomal protein L5 [Candidatus Yanofskybacteria bacterium RIFCSPHIGHO2_02_FULL_50_12]
MNSLLQQYRKTVIPAMQKEFSIDNVMAVPKIEKVTVNVGVGRIHKDDAAIERIAKDIGMLAGQKPVLRNAKKSIASFKLREGAPVGVSVTLRGGRMWDFIDRLVNIALPRSKDFRGIEQKNVDASGNLNLGIKESSIFPELNYENSKDIFSLQITITTTARTKEQGIALLKNMGFPIKKD